MNTDLRGDNDANNEFVDQLTEYLDRQASDAEDVVEFAVVTRALRAPATWSAPPPGLRDAILARVRDQAAPVPKQQPAPAANAQPAAHQSRWRSRRGRLTWAIPAAAVAAAIFTAGIVAVDRALQPDQPAGETYAATGTQLAPGATATVVVSANPSGFALRVTATGLPAAAPGSYYSAWLHGPRGVIPLGSFHQHQQGGSVALWSGVDPKDYTSLVITLQAESQPPSMSNLVVMTATLNR